MTDTKELIAYVRKHANASCPDFARADHDMLLDLASALEASEARAEAIATEAMDQTVYIIRQKEKIERLRAVAREARKDVTDAIREGAPPRAWVLFQLLDALQPGDLDEI